MTVEFTPAQLASLTEAAEREYFAAYYNEVVEEEIPYEDQYSWNKYTQTNECEDWDVQDGTWGVRSDYAFA